MARMTKHGEGPGGSVLVSSCQNDPVSKACKACIVDIVSFIEKCFVKITLSVRLARPV